jgi:lactate racemase
MLLIQKSNVHGFLTNNELAELIAEGLRKANLRGKKVLTIIPDSTRTAPVGEVFRLFCENLQGVAKKLDFLIALGTHPPMTEAQIDKLLKMSAADRKQNYPEVGVFNHEWDNPKQLVTIGTISMEEVERFSNGLMHENVPVQCNRMLFDYDQIIIVGPTFPHEVVGFSGGNKYFFPGVSGPEVLNFFHWLGAVITNPVINGAKMTPVRRVVDHAASMIKLPKLCFSLVTAHEGVRGIFVGSPEEAYDKAADLSAATQIVYAEHPYKRILSIAPHMYDDLWTGGKCMYKLEPVLAEGGELIIYAPHITEVSYTHGKVLDRIGYHCRDYFLKRMEQFKEYPRGVIAHSTHVKGIGTYINGVEKPRATVTLATQIPKERCDRINLGYMNPAKINIEEFKGRESEGILCVPNAGEHLYRLADGTVPRI